MNVTSLEGYLDGCSLPDAVEVAQYNGEVERNGEEFLLSGRTLIVLGRRKGEVLQIRDEESAIEIDTNILASLSVSQSRTFCVLSSLPSLDGAVFGTVEDIMVLSDSARPPYVVATSGWMSDSGDIDISAGEVFRVSTRITRASNGDLCVVWERCRTSTRDTPMQRSVLDEAESRPIKLGFSTACAFMASAEETVYSLSALDDLVREKKLTCPVRLQEVQTTGGPIVRRRKYCLTGTKTLEWMLAVCNNPSTGGNHELVKIQLSTSLSREIQVSRPNTSDPKHIQQALSAFIMQSTDRMSVDEIKARPRAPATYSLPTYSTASIRSQSSTQSDNYETLDGDEKRSSAARADDYEALDGTEERPGVALADRGKIAPALLQQHNAMHRSTPPIHQVSESKSNHYVHLLPPADRKFGNIPSQPNVSESFREQGALASSTTSPLQGSPKLPVRSACPMQDSRRLPKGSTCTLQDSPKLPPRSLQESPRLPRRSACPSQESPKLPRSSTCPLQDSPKLPARSLQDSPKLPPRSLQESPRLPRRSACPLQESPKVPRRSPKLFSLARKLI
eukprot:scpid51919/ scgid2692/ 